jgi:hypothetical protein
MIWSGVLSFCSTLCESCVSLCLFQALAVCCLTWCFSIIQSRWRWMFDWLSDTLWTTLSSLWLCSILCYFHFGLCSNWLKRFYLQYAYFGVFLCNLICMSDSCFGLDMRNIFLCILYSSAVSYTGQEVHERVVFRDWDVETLVMNSLMF